MTGGFERVKSICFVRRVRGFKTGARDHKRSQNQRARRCRHSVSTVPMSPKGTVPAPPSPSCCCACTTSAPLASQVQPIDIHSQARLAIGRAEIARVTAVTATDRHIDRRSSHRRRSRRRSSRRHSHHRTPPQFPPQAPPQFSPQRRHSYHRSCSRRRRSHRRISTVECTLRMMMLARRRWVRRLLRSRSRAIVNHTRVRRGRRHLRHAAWSHLRRYDTAGPFVDSAGLPAVAAGRARHCRERGRSSAQDAPEDRAGATISKERDMNCPPLIGSQARNADQIQTGKEVGKAKRCAGRPRWGLIRPEGTHSISKT